MFSALLFWLNDLFSLACRSCFACSTTRISSKLLFFTSQYFYLCIIGASSDLKPKKSTDDSTSFLAVSGLTGFGCSSPSAYHCIYFFLNIFLLVNAIGGITGFGCSNPSAYHRIYLLLNIFLLVNAID
jgi:hypothetical protein